MQLKEFRLTLALAAFTVLGSSAAIAGDTFAICGNTGGTLQAEVIATFD